MMSLAEEEDVGDKLALVRETLEVKLQKLNARPIELGGLFDVGMTGFKEDAEFKDAIAVCKDKFLSDPFKIHEYEFELGYLASPVLTDFDYFARNPDKPLQLWMKSMLTLRFYMKLVKVDKRLLCILACKLNDLELFKILSMEAELYDYLIESAISNDRVDFLEYYFTTWAPVSKLVMDNLEQAFNNNSLKCLQFILDRIVGSKSAMIIQLFVWAIAHNNMKVFDMMIDMGVDINPGNGGMSHIKVAVGRNKYEPVKRLLDLKAKTGGQDLLRMAISLPDNKIADLLIERGIDVIVPYNTECPLHAAIFKGKLDIFKKLVELGCPIYGESGSASADAIAYDQCDIFKYVVNYSNINLYSVRLVKMSLKLESKIYKYVEDIEKELLGDSKQDVESLLQLEEPAQMNGTWRAEWVGNTRQPIGFRREGMIYIDHRPIQEPNLRMMGGIPWAAIPHGDRNPAVDIGTFIPPGDNWF